MEIAKLLKDTNFISISSNEREMRKAQRTFLCILGYHSLFGGLVTIKELLDSGQLTTRILECGLASTENEAKREIISLLRPSDGYIYFTYNGEYKAIDYHFQEFVNRSGDKKYQLQKSRDRSSVVLWPD